MTSSSKTVVDVGYLSYMASVFSTSALNYTSQYIRALWVFDMPSLREQEFPSYKGHRKERLSHDTKRQEMRARVIQLRKEWWSNYSLNRMRADGYEGDDLIASLVIRGDTRWVVGVDKDYAFASALARLKQKEVVFSSATEERDPVDSLLSKLPKYLQPLWTGDPRDLVLLQCLHGDSSDDVPKLDTWRNLKPLVESLSSLQGPRYPRTYWKILEMYPALTKQIELILMPHHSLWPCTIDEFFSIENPLNLPKPSLPNSFEMRLAELEDF